MKWFRRTEVWEIGPFQLENVVANVTGTLLFDLSQAELGSENPAVAQLLAGRVSVASDELEGVIAKKALNAGHPIVLICERGDLSSNAARRLMDLKYTNVYVVEGGLQAIRDYFADMT